LEYNQEIVIQISTKHRTYKQSDIIWTNPRIFKDKACKWCKTEFKPKAPSHLFCSDNCKDTHFTDTYFVQKYNITFKEVKNLLEKQNYVCAICEDGGFKMHPNSWSSLNVDHCHETGAVRGLLCHNCNRALGLLKDNINNLRKAIKYLEGN
jgi:hypothetical protein